MAAFSFGQGQTNYTGEVLADILAYASEENETYKEGLIHIKAGIQKKYALPHVSLGSIIQDRKATPDSSEGEYQFSERYLEPENYMVYLEFNPRDFEVYYKPFQPDGNLVFRQLDPKVQATMARLLLDRKNEYTNHSIWCSCKSDVKAMIGDGAGANQGNTEIGSDDAAGPMKYYYGAIARMLMNYNAAAGSEDAKTGKITLAGTGTFANGEAIEAELFAMWKKVEPKVRKKAGFKILIDYKSWDTYNQYLAGKYAKYNDNRVENEHTFQGKRIIPLTCLPDDTIIMGVFTTGQDSNLWMGVDYDNDENVLVVDRLQNNSELYFFKMLFKMDVNIVRPSEITAHLPFTYGGAATTYTMTFKKNDGTTMSTATYAAGAAITYPTPTSGYKWPDSKPTNMPAADTEVTEVAI